ncbi:MAG: hypothetical protein V9H25_08320 [Candidatus Competibacter sp.]
MQNELLENPERGDLIQGGRMRVIYYWGCKPKSPIFPAWQVFPFTMVWTAKFVPVKAFKASPFKRARRLRNY